MPIENTPHSAQTLPSPIARQKIGLFGGSFNPAHSGHLDVSQFALNSLELDEIWWLVSPQNPLKTKKDMAPLHDRIQSCIDQIENTPNIRILGLETLLETQYTVDTVTAIQEAFADVYFVWIMGADNLTTLHQWKDWQGLWNRIPMAIVNRYGYDQTPHNTPLLQEYVKCKTTLKKLVTTPAPVWATLAMPPNPSNSTDMRNSER